VTPPTPPGDISRSLYNRRVRLAIAQTQVQGWTVFPLYWRIACFAIPCILSIPAAIIAGIDDAQVRVRMFIQAICKLFPPMVP
jgi:hypothetical protein